MIWRGGQSSDPAATGAVNARQAEASAAAARGDYEAALAIWVKDAHAGVARAQAEIGRCFVSGLGVERDVEAAARWWRMAALRDDPDGQAMLGAAYQLGAGIEQDQVAALAWLIRARLGRSQFADRFYPGVHAGCSAEQRREAEQRATLPLAFEEVVR